MTTIKLKNGSGAPTAGDLAQGEPALDLTNKRLYTEDSGGTVIEVGTNPGTDVTFADNRKAIFGAGSDLQIYHDGGTSRIVDSGTGNLIIAGTELGLMNAAQTTYHLFAQDGGDVRLGYNGSYKLATTATGIDVTGSISADGLTVEGSSTGAFNAATFYNSDTTVNSGVDLTFNCGSSGTATAKIKAIRSFAGYSDLAFQTEDNDNLRTRLLIDSTGDISFYEDTGTTAKLLWSASNELLEVSSTGNGYAFRPSATTSDYALMHVQAQDGTAMAAVRLDGSSGLRFHTGGTNNAAERMRIDSSGVVQIGPSGSTGDRELRFETGSGSASGEDAIINSYRSNADLILKTNDTERMRIDSSGEFTLGNPSAGSALQLDVSATGTDGVDIKSTYYSGGYGPMKFHAGGTERMRIDSTGIDVTGTAVVDGLTVDGNDSYTSNIRFTYGTSFPTYFADWGYKSNSDGNKVFLTITDGGSANDVLVANYDGKVGIGTISPDEKLDVENGNIRLKSNSDGNTGLFRLYDSAGVESGQIYPANGDLNFYSPNDVIFSPTGKVGIGETLPAATLHVKTSTNTPLLLESTIGSGGYAEFQLGASGATIGYLGSAGAIVTSGAVADLAVRSQANLTFATGGSTERMRIDSSGNLLVGTTSTADSDVGGKIFSDGRMVQGVSGTGLADMHDFYRGTAGSLSRVGNIRTNGTSTTYNTSSDQRLKENIVDAPSASDDIDAIQVRSFDWKADGSHQKYGMVAQELQSVAPEAVTGDADSDDMMGVDYSKLVPMMLKEIQSLRARVAQLEGVN